MSHFYVKYEAMRDVKFYITYEITYIYMMPRIK